MVDKISVAVAAVVALTVVYTGGQVVAKMNDPAFMCESAFDEEWVPAENASQPENGWACRAPNGTVEVFTIENVSSQPASVSPYS